MHRRIRPDFLFSVRAPPGAPSPSIAGAASSSSPPAAPVHPQASSSRPCRLGEFPVSLTASPRASPPDLSIPAFNFVFYPLCTRNLSFFVNSGRRLRLSIVPSRLITDAHGPHLSDRRSSSYPVLLSVSPEPRRNSSSTSELPPPRRLPSPPCRPHRADLALAEPRVPHSTALPLPPVELAVVPPVPVRRRHGSPEEAMAAVRSLCVLVHVDATSLCVSYVWA